MAVYINPILLDKLFLPIKPSEKKKLKIDYESLYSITLPQTSNEIVHLIIEYLTKEKIDYKLSTIIDATAGVGGDTISFSFHFKKVYSIEINSIRYSFLVNNLNIYNIKNVVTYNNSYLDIINNLNADVIFLDPPWGGRSYKHIENLKLYLDNKPIEKVCLDILFKNVPPKLIVLKLPNNYYFENFDVYNLIVKKHTLYKITIIIIDVNENLKQLSKKI